jgi:uncharacterized protein (TIGR03435 family)
MTGTPGLRLSLARKMLVLLVGIVSVATPIFSGAVRRQLSAASEGRLVFDRATIAANRHLASDTVALNSVRNPGFVNTWDSGTLTAGWATPRSLIQEAYGLKPFQLIGGPAWIDSDRYDIFGEPAGRASEDELLKMLQSLLADRFRLKLHTETRNVPVYVIRVANNGLVQSSPMKCIRPGDPPLARVPDRDIPWQSVPPCGRVQIALLSPTVGWLVGAQVSISELTSDLASILGRPVIDRTGFEGRLDVQVQFTPDDTLAGLWAPAGGPPAPEPVWSSLSRELEENTGLRIESATTPVNVMVIDSIERPVED